MSVIDNLKKRLDINNDSDNYQYYNKKQSNLKNMQVRLNAFGGTDQWTRMREDKLRSLKKALLYSYQSAIVQRYNVRKDSLANSIISIITLLQDQQELSENQVIILDKLEKEYSYLEGERGSIEYIRNLQSIVDQLTNAEPYFRCLINHDKLKVDYEDKIISIPFMQPPVGSVEPEETNFHNGTVFKWVHGNREEWTPDTYWIVYMQYSEETAYFRGQIRKADQEIEIVVIDSEGNEESKTYRGWMTGPNETTALWNVKKNVTWNDLNYTKILYITKDEDTLAFFQRFDRVLINGKPWEVQAYNESYSKGKNGDYDSGIIRVALKQTYTSTDQFIKQTKQAAEDAKQKQIQYDATHSDPRIDGPRKVYPFQTVTFVAKDFDTETEKSWNISNNEGLAKIDSISEDGYTVTVSIVTGRSSKTGFDINYGEDESTNVHVIIASL